jgi:hypothetical protein
MNRHAWQRRPGVAWAAAGAVAGLVILGAVLVFTAATRSANARRQIANPVVTLVPRSTATELVRPSPTSFATETPAPVPVKDPNSGQIGVGLIVEVYGTEGDGLRLRADPSTAGAIQVLADETEVFSVQDGPVEADGQTWFYLVSPSDASRAGWAVSRYLRPAQ